MRMRKKQNHEEENFWLSATDLMAGILTIVLLLLMLFILYLNQSKDEVFTPLDASEYPTFRETNPYDYEFPTDGTQTVYATEPTVHYDDDNDGSSGGAPTEAQTEYHAGDNGEDGYDKAAVFVTVVDADTGNTIKKSGIEFELYAYKNGIGGLQTLHTYYPKKVEYKKFETDNRGTFYLPEKITRGWYSLQNLVPPEGYYVDENTDFEIDDFWDWSEPYMVTVSMKPIKKTIRVSAEDSVTKEGVADVSYQVVAAEEIRSADGTVRCSPGEVVDEITTNETGYAESMELYIGKYYVKEIAAPEYYALNDAAVSARVAETAQGDTGLVKMDCYKTAVTVRLIDERTEHPVKGAVYRTDDGSELVTDSSGHITVTDLTKKTTYHLTCVSVPDGYIKKNNMIRFSVDSDGLVNDKASAVIDDTVYTICMTVDVKDYLFGRTAKGVDLMLMDENLNELEEWTINDQTHIVSGLSEGKYFVQRIGDESTRFSVYLTDTADLQTVEMLVWDTLDLFTMLIAGPCRADHRIVYQPQKEGEAYR